MTHDIPAHSYPPLLPLSPWREDSSLLFPPQPFFISSRSQQSWGSNTTPLQSFDREDSAGCVTISWQGPEPSCGVQGERWAEHLPPLLLLLGNSTCEATTSARTLSPDPLNCLRALPDRMATGLANAVCKGFSIQQRKREDKEHRGGKPKRVKKRATAPKWSPM